VNNLPLALDHLFEWLEALGIDANTQGAAAETWTASAGKKEAKSGATV
jgi:hypothetical protein